MNNVAKNMDSLFATASEEELEFDAIFDQEDSLIDTVIGVDEAGDPLTGVDFETLHNEEEDSTANDVRDVRSDDVRNGAKKPEGTIGYDILDLAAGNNVNDKSDANDFYDGIDKEYNDGKGCSNCNCKVDPEKIDDYSCCKESIFLSEGHCKEEDDVDSELVDDEDDFEESFLFERNSEEEDDVDLELADDDDHFGESFLFERNCKEEDDVDSELADDEDEDDFEESFLFGSFGESDAFDNDVESLVDDDEDGDEDAVDSVKAKGGDYSYEISDEEIIDIALNGDK